MKNLNVRRAWALFLVLAVLVSCASCYDNTAGSTSADQNEILAVPSALYELYRKNDGIYIRVSEELKANGTSEGGLVAVPNVRFSSLAEMKERIIGGKLTENELKQIQSFPKDSATAEIGIWDPNRLFSPVLPGGMQYGNVIWYGQSYQIMLSSENQYRGAVSFLPENQYESDMKRAVDGIYNNSLYTIISQTPLTDRNGEEIIATTSVAKMKELCYSYETTAGSFFVIETYTLEHSQMPDRADSTIPRSVNIYGQVNNIYFKISLSSQENTSQAPSLQWVHSFGIQAFEENTDTLFGVGIKSFPKTAI